ncbi:unnamed protein product [Linum trigynum]|uniref:Uncharacterized protein n=1 Tax=Linum trigynum TaxID=586398 RepID=A0AAV2D8W0_9ROSI
MMLLPPSPFNSRHSKASMLAHMTLYFVNQGWRSSVFPSPYFVTTTGCWSLVSTASILVACSTSLAVCSS